MSLLKIVFLAIVQGITEFFPISSSGHLVILEHLFKIEGDKVFLTVILHAGTFFSVLIFYRKRVLEIIKNFLNLIIKPKSVDKSERDYILGIIIVTIITGGIALLLKDFFESLFSKPIYTSVALFITGLILLLTQKAKEKKGIKTLKDSVFIGLAQSFAIIPGISRSGSTISTTLFLGWNKKKGAEFSFIAFLPAMFGAIILEAKKIGAVNNFLPLFIGFIISFLTGLIAIKYLIKLIENRKFYLFGIYCLIISILSFFYFL